MQPSSIHIADASSAHGGRQEFTPFFLSDHLPPEPFVAPPALDAWVARHGSEDLRAAQRSIFATFSRPRDAEAQDAPGLRVLPTPGRCEAYVQLGDLITSMSSCRFGDVRAFRYDSDHWAHFGVVSSRTACAIGIIEGLRQSMLDRLSGRSRAGFPTYHDVQRAYDQMGKAYEEVLDLHAQVAQAHRDMGRDRGDGTIRAILHACAPMQEAALGRPEDKAQLWDLWHRRAAERHRACWAEHAEGMHMILQSLASLHGAPRSG